MRVRVAGVGMSGRSWWNGFAWIALVLLSSVVGPGRVRANVAPEATVSVHVRAPAPSGPDGCAIPGLVHCSDIVNTTELTGLVEFDVFAQPGLYSPSDQIESLDTQLTWPPSWQFVSWEPCNGVDVDFTPSAGSANLWALWPSCPQVGEIHLVGRLVIDVDRYGRLQPSLYDGVLRVNCPQPVELQALGIFAEAGVNCDYTMLACNTGNMCDPTLAQNAVAFSSGPGGQLTADIPFTAWSWIGTPCTYTTATEAAWLHASYEALDLHHYLLHLSCDVVGLETGNYSSRAILTMSPYPRARRCVEVTLEVPATSDAPSGDGQTRRVQTSWGKLKAAAR